MESEIQLLLNDFAVSLRAVCSDPDLSVLLYNPPVDNRDLLLCRGRRCEIPEFADEDAVVRLAETAFNGRLSPGDQTRRHVSGDGHSVLLEIPFSVLMNRPDRDLAALLERRQFAPLSSMAPDGCFCVGASTLAPVESLVRLLNLDGDAATAPDDVMRGLLSLAARLICCVFDRARWLRDPISLLPGRMEFELALKGAMEDALRDQQPLAVLLINPDDFVMVNHRYGRGQGDTALREIAWRLRSCVRDSDSVFRCGGAAFAVLLPATSVTSADQAARKFQAVLSEHPYLEERLDLTFTFSGAAMGLEDLSAELMTSLSVIREAERSMHKAKLAGDGGVLVTRMSQATDDLDHFDPSNGIFTADSEKDYRNMLLLWESVAMVSALPDPETLAQAFVDRLHARFWTDQVTLVYCESDQEAVVLASRCREPAIGTGAADEVMTLEPQDAALVREALSARELKQRAAPVVGEQSLRLTYALPLIAPAKAVGCVLISGSESLLFLDATDLIFLNALSNQVAMALDRFALAAKEIRATQREKRELQQEVRELRHALKQTQLVFQSATMHELMRVLRRIAPSDATVLITGESGTGKEMLANAVHEFSHRNEAPMVTVDCGAITHSLLEAELFGYRKGAYTGADSASEGRIVAADGGTLFLDEVGELPLNVQAKLLRFVQERELTPVGGTVSRRVNVRIIAATNRDLEAQVSAGRFREDLYYRLQVVTLRAPALRERADDILPVANFFLCRFAEEHGSAVTRFSADAERSLLAHSWPGNVRELQHCILRSVLMCDGDVLRAGDLYLRDKLGALPGSEVEAKRGSLAVVPAHLPSPPTVDLVSGTTFGALEACLADQLEHALNGNPNRPVPVGRWLQEDLVLIVSSHNGNIGRRAARMIGVPESTFRRQLDRARADLVAGIAVRSDAWVSVSSVLEVLVEGSTHSDCDGLLNKVRLTLLGLVEARTRGRPAIGAALMGVTPSTYKRWLSNGVRAA